MNLKKRVAKDYKDIQLKANALFQVSALNIGRIIEKAGQDIVQSLALNLSQFPTIDFMQLNALGTFDRLESLIKLRLKHAAIEVSDQWTHSRSNFPILARASMSFISRKSSPPWINVTLNLKDKVDSARDGARDPRMGHIQFYFDKMADLTIQQLKQGTLSGENLHQVLERIRPLFSNRKRVSKESNEPYKVQTKLDIEAEDLLKTTVQIEEGYFTLEDMQSFIEDLRVANNWEYRQYKPWFSEELKRKNSFLRSLEQILYADATALLHDNQIQIGPKEMGIDDFVWITAKQETTCEICGKRHEMTMRDIKKKIKDKYKDQPPPLHPNCNCQLVPKINEEWTKSAAENNDLSWDANTGLVYKADKLEKKYNIQNMTFDEYMDKFAR